MLNLKNLSYRAWGEDFQLDLSLELYAENKEPAVTAATTEGEPFATITVNVPDTPHGCVAVRDDYPFYPQLLERAGVIEDLLVVDHLHLMPRPNKNTVQELDEITARLKRLAMELDIHVLLVAQLSRAVNGRPDKRPQMSDLRESGGIEQNANIIIFPYRPGYYDASVNQNEAELILAKNRDGERGSVIVGWQGRYQRFVDQPDPWEPPAQVEQEAKDDPFNV